MDKKEYVLSFIEKIKNNDFDELYKYFTSRSIIASLDDNHQYDVTSFLEYLDATFKNQELEIKRVFESGVAVKVEISSPNFNHDAMIFEVKDRRFNRVELF